ncbi:MAG: hypothetical protein HGA70_07595 [Chlorobiaceae bacterium]|nr:hypothetical protein [Chlorobiaceae bacterium]
MDNRQDFSRINCGDLALGHGAAVVEIAFTSDTCTSVHSKIQQAQTC